VTDHEKFGPTPAHRMRAGSRRFPPPLPAAEVAERVKEVLAQTEIVEVSPGHEVVFSPDAVWDLHDEADLVFSSVVRGGRVTWEVQCSEEMFWGLVAKFLGPQEVAEMKQQLADLAVWEGEGGSCMVG